MTTPQNAGPDVPAGVTGALAPDERPASPPWVGACASVLIFLGLGWVIAYGLLDIGPQQRLGAWNYLIGLLVTLGAGPVLRAWRGDPHRVDTPGSAPRRRV